MEKIKGYILGAISAITYGFIPLFTFPVMEEGMGIESILFYRFFLAAVVIGGILIYRKERVMPAKKDLIMILMLGLLYSGASLSLFWSFNYLPGGVAATIMFLYPVFVAIIMTTVFKEKISIIAITSIAVAIGGVFMLYRGEGGVSLNVFGVVLALLSGISYGAYIIFVNKSKKAATMSSLRITFYACAATAVIFLSLSLFKGGVQPIETARAAINLSLLSIVPTALSCITLAIAVRLVGSTTISILGALEPVSAVICGILFLHEVFTISLAWGIFMIIASVMLIVVDKSKDKILGKMQHRRSRR